MERYQKVFVIGIVISLLTTLILYLFPSPGNPHSWVHPFVIGLVTIALLPRDGYHAFLFLLLLGGGLLTLGFTFPYPAAELAGWTFIIASIVVPGLRIFIENGQNSADFEQLRDAGVGGGGGS